MNELNLSDYLIVFRRWQKLFLTVFGILLAITLILCLRWSTYRSTAVVQVDQSIITADATTPSGTSVRDTMEDLADQRISSIQQKVTSTASLIEIITKFDLYANERRQTPIADIAEAMRKKIKVELVSSRLANPAAAGRVSAQQLSAIAFKLSYSYTNPLLTQQVSDELVSRFLDEDLKERRTQAQETSAFLGDQIATLEASLVEQEKKIADFQKIHGITRPDSLAFNQQTAANLTLSLQNLDGQIATNESTIGTLQAQLATVDPYSRVIADGQVLTSPSIQLKALQAQYASLGAQYGPEHPDVVKVRHQIEALQTQVGGVHSNSRLKAQIEDTRTNLEAAQKTYGPEHPDVLALQHELQKLEDQLATARTHLNNGDGIIADADNPVYMQISSQLRTAQDQHKELMEQRHQLQTQQEEYQRAVTENPEAEKEMAALTRDYENGQLRYREMKERKMAADMDEKMQEERKGERLTLIDPPELPSSTTPPRSLLVFGAFLVSFLCGTLAVGTAQMLSQSVIGRRHLENLSGLSPLVCIPHITTKAERELSVQHRIGRLIEDLISRVDIPRAQP